MSSFCGDADSIGCANFQPARASRCSARYVVVRRVALIANLDVASHQSYWVTIVM